MILSSCLNLCNLCVFRKCDACGKQDANFCCAKCNIHYCYFCNIEAARVGAKKIDQCPMCFGKLK